MCTKVEKPDCYNCIHRGHAVGSAHSRCDYPGTDTGMLSLFASENRSLAVALNIRGNFHGIRNGWFLWPVNFDPTWLENCDGFTEKTNEQGSDGSAPAAEKKYSQ